MPRETLEHIIREIATKHGPGRFLSDTLVRVYALRIDAAVSKTDEPEGKHDEHNRS